MNGIESVWVWNVRAPIFLVVLSEDVYGTLRATEVDSTLRTIKDSQFDLGLGVQRPHRPHRVNIQTCGPKVRRYGIENLGPLFSNKLDDALNLL